ncbi:hypothetical protein ACTXT7_014666 [Hymenolepis weldensis]
MSKRAHRFPPFYSSLVSPKKHIYVHVLTRPYPSESYKAIFVFHPITTHGCQLPAPIASSSSPLFLSTLPSLSPSLSLALILVAVSLNTIWSNQLLVFCSRIVVSSYSNTYELVTVIAVRSLNFTAIQKRILLLTFNDGFNKRKDALRETGLTSPRRKKLYSFFGDWGL